MKHLLSNFAEADVFYPSASPLGFTWGTAGTTMLRRLQDCLSERLGSLGYEEIILPSLLDRAKLARYLGDKTAALMTVGGGAGQDSVLAPFSDLLYLDHLAMNPDGDRHRRAIAWSRCFLSEDQERYLDFGEYIKCEIFGLSDSREQAMASWTVLNAAFRSLCKDDLNIAPLSGERPRVTLFPLAERSFVIELSLSDGLFQTIFASHVMQTGYMAETGYRALEGQAFNSACFSQKLLASVLLHHRDAAGFRWPPALAPTLGLIIGTGPDALSSAAIERLGGAARIRFFEAAPTESVPAVLAAAGALWALERNLDGNGNSTWRLYRRLAPDDSPVVFGALDGAVSAAVHATVDFGAALRAESAAKTARDLAAIIGDAGQPESLPGGSGALNSLASCCDRERCVRTLAERTRRIPKLVFPGQQPRPCETCATATLSQVLFEREETYTSFYVPTQARLEQPA